MGFQLHPIDEIVNVSWTGMIAAVGTEVADDPSTSGRIYRGSPATGDQPQKWEVIKELPDIAIRALSYALVNGANDPAFVMGGASVSTVDILYSRDARTWSTALRASYFDTGAFGITGIVWDDNAQAFYAASGATTEDIYQQYQLWRSTDGQSWSKTAELTAVDADADEVVRDQITDLLLAHCTKRENTGGTQSKVPDGYQAYDKAKDIFMTPDALSGWDIGGPLLGTGTPNAITVKGRRDENGNRIESETRVLPVDYVRGVSFGGGMWTAVGQRRTNEATFQKPTVMFCSSDDGQSWNEVFQHDDWIPAGIVSASKGDIGPV